jgi:hypothetical protein
MLSVKVEQHVNVKFLAKLGKSTTETFQYDSETKHQSMHWKSPTSKKKSMEEQVQFESNDDRFFDIRGIVHIDWVPERPTVNWVYYKDVLTILHERVRRKIPEIWKNGSRILHYDNAPAHNALSYQDVSGETQDPRAGKSILLT